MSMSDDYEGLNPEEEWGFTTKKKGEWVELEGCECLRESDSGKAVLVRDDKGTKRWVPISQIHHESEIQKAGDTGTLMISRWLFERWDEQKPVKATEPPVEVPGCVCLGEARSGKAIKVRFPDEREEWIPVTQIEENSEVRYDSDAGVLRVSAWIAREKGIIAKEEPAPKALEDDDIPF